METGCKQHSIEIVKNSSRSGFSILELAVVLTVISLIVGSALAVGATRIQAAKIQETEAKMKAISDILDSFVQTYGYIPCPADPIALTTAPEFGVSNCASPNVVSSGTARIGVVPTVTLGLAPAVMMDGWNRRITYAMDTRLSDKNGYNTGDVTGATTYLTIYSTKTPVPYLVTKNAVVVFVSYGPDGHGAWKAKGGAGTVQADPAPGDADSLENCNGQPGCLSDSSFVQKFRTEIFDDIVYYRLQWQLPCYRTSDGSNLFQCK